MRKVYATRPSEEVVRRELDRLSKQLSVVTPTLIFWSHGNAQCDYDTNTIKLPSPAWTDEFDPMCTPACYWGAAVLHEFAHYLDHVWNDGDGHSAEMYAIQTGLILHEDLPLDEFYFQENKYKPRSFFLGRKMAGTAILADFKAASFREAIR
jgi:hypothetical protein